MNEDLHKAHRARMRERFLESPESFTKHELLEFLLYQAIPRRNVNSEAHKLIAKYGSINEVLHADPTDLAEVDGIGVSAATFLAAVGRIVDVVNEEKQDETKIYSLESVKEYLVNSMGGLTEEVVCAFYLSKSNRIIKRETYTDKDEGKVSVSLAPFTRAFANLKPYAVVVAHNHPSGIAKPSKADDGATEKMFLLFSLANVKLYDHIIVTSGGVYSYRLDGRLSAIEEYTKKEFNA